MEMPMSRKLKCTRGLAVLLGACVASACSVAIAAEGAKPPTIDAVLDRLGYTAEHKATLFEGGIVATDLKRTRDDQLIAAVAVLVQAPLATLADNARRGLNIERDEATTAFGRLDGQAGSEQFLAARYDEADRREVERLLGAAADGTFNLSKAELEALHGALGGVKPGDGAAADRASQAYQAVLAGRHKAYVETGLDGIADYTAGARLKPAEELRAAYAQAKPFLDELFPAFSRALGEFPAGQSPDISNSFYWMKRDVEGRPAFVLVHQMVQSGDDFALLSQRQYFVGHTYESLQVVSLALPSDKGTVVFYVNSAYTDKVTGFFSGVAQSVGQSRTKEDLIEYFERARKSVQQ
jgi:hypothetical protein